MLVHALPAVGHDPIDVDASRLIRLRSTFVPVAASIVAGALIALAPALVSFIGAVLAACLWCRRLERHDVPVVDRPQDFLRHSLSPLQGHTLTVHREEFGRDAGQRVARH